MEINKTNIENALDLLDAVDESKDEKVRVCYFDEMETALHRTRILLESIRRKLD